MQEKSTKSISTIGFAPKSAAPTAIPTKEASEIGVSMSLSNPNCSKSLSVTLYYPPFSAIPSPIQKTNGSDSISSRIASLSASRYLSIVIENPYIR